MDNIALLILGIFISVIGIVNMTGNISTIHSYNRRKVKEEDVPKYGRAVGTGMSRRVIHSLVYSSPSLCNRIGRSSPLPLIVQYFRLGLEPRVYPISDR